MKSFLAATAIAGLTLSLYPAAALANELALEEVVVTAQKRAQSLQDVPISMSAVTGEKIKEAGISRIEDLSAYVPNLKMTQTPLGNSIFIRGVGSGINRGFEQSVGMFIDGIYAGRGHQFRAPFLDVGLVEVLKGPQGTLLGKNTIAGAINITTARPGRDWEAEITAAYEKDFNGRDLSVVLSAPLGDDMGLRFAGKRTTTDGYMDNFIRDTDEPERKESVLRLVWEWDVNDRLSAAAKIETGKFDAFGTHHQLTDITGDFELRGQRVSSLEDLIDPREDGRFDDLKSEDSFPGKDQETLTDNESAVLSLDYQLGDTLTLTSITGYSAFEFFQVLDGDFTDLHFISVDIGEDFEQWSQEFRLTGNFGERIDFVTGIYLQEQELFNFQIIDIDLEPVLPGGFSEEILPGVVLDRNSRLSTVADYTQDASSQAVFGQATWRITDAVHVTLGVRWGTEKKEVDKGLLVAEFRERTQTADESKNRIANAVSGANPHRLSDEREVSNVSPSLNIQYYVSDDIMTYLRYSKGFKSGGFNASDASGNPDTFEFDEEEADTYELGAKLTLLDGAAELNAAYFYTEFMNRQVSAFTVTGFVVGNAAESISQGAELDFRWRPRQNVILNGSLAYLDSSFSDFANAACTSQQVQDGGDAFATDCRQDLSGKTTEYAPPWTASFGGVLILPISGDVVAKLGADVNYSDGYYHAEDHDKSDFQGEYIKYNMRFSVGDLDGQWEIALLGKNLSDETTRTNGTDVPVFLGAHFAGTAPPRTWTLQGVWRY